MPTALVGCELDIQTPIVDERERIIGWTKTTPELYGAVVHHEQAERLVGGPVECAFIEIADKKAAAAAGAPIGWRGSWRCLALRPAPDAMTRRRR
jgi:hypothetical protein